MSGAKDRLGMEVHALLLEDKAEWAQAIDDILGEYGEAGVREILRSLQDHVLSLNIPLDEATLNTPYRNTIGPESQPAYPGNLALEERIEKIIRWNAIAMVLQAQDKGIGVGGHIATYASCATLLEVGFNHFFRGAGANNNRGAVDMLLPQPHAAPGIYARAFLEGRLSETHLKNYRQELGEGGGLSSYPHPRSMPDFWEVPNASMGLSTPAAIYQARFAKYLENRGLKEAASGKVWCFIGDGESDEPEVLGTINIAAREKLDNLVLVVNCNLQRLDGPVRGNGKIIQELERVFRGADWQVLKVIWGSGWDALLSRDSEGVLQRRMDECLDGDYQMYSVLPGDVQREHWVEGNAALEQMMNTLTDEEVKAIKRGGQDQKKIFAAFAKASEPNGKPTVILVKTVKGDGMGAQGKNTAHQYKNIPVEERVTVAKELGIPLDDKAAMAAQFYRPAEDSPELIYMREQREKLDGYLPNRNVSCAPLQIPQLERFKEILAGSGKREVSTTMVMVRLMSSLLRMPEVAKYIVPIVPDEARTFGMDGLFKAAGIYSADGQKYRPVDADSLLPYREANDGQILQEGICEVGAMASFMAAGSAYSVHGLPMIPFYIFYSMFGFQRVGDMIWSCGDMMCKGFLLGGTAGRTTLNGEGLQHQDGHSHILASTVPSLLSYDPAFGYEVAVIVREGMRRMYEEQEDIFYYLTLYNENHLMPDMAEVLAVTDQTQEALVQSILQGGYCFSRTSDAPAQIHLLSSGSIMQQVMAAASQLEKMGFNVAIWSMTSFVELQRQAMAVDRSNRDADATAKDQQVSNLEQMFAGQSGAFVAVTDYMASLALGIAAWMPEGYEVLGTDGFGLSESRPALRAHFEVDAKTIVRVALINLRRQALMSDKTLSKHLQTVSE
ncbi:MAG: pyruvate dehydrogenase (acetyl-transferring), homodimeric type [Gammaproteobacteria bacterium]|jgi:pyruvate dehydrogenase E1 component|nr:pyruvate dehydrogenase (acetyl-transferring), homodimeric type [Gammaproteobacteria bacterium]MBT5682600.1 pyruvate dehydrogenase (acetyl-transferring), homodimeric type [Gammaproteobacteria bacterium]MBT6557156.1 pyruvate dehydrogenase (acetyl-transferring), homodimeric type [Gammaproteobacteria bacterium]